MIEDGEDPMEMSLELMPKTTMAMRLKLDLDLVREHSYSAETAASEGVVATESEARMAELVARTKVRTSRSRR